MRIVFFTIGNHFGLFAPYLTVNCTGSPPSIDKNLRLLFHVSNKSKLLSVRSMQVLWRLLGKSSIVTGLKCLTLKRISGYDMYNRVHSLIWFNGG
jgi:hypothetical protein